MRHRIIAGLALAATAATIANAEEATPDWQYYQDKENTNDLLQAFVQSKDGYQLILKCDKAGKGSVYAIVVAPKELVPPNNVDQIRSVYLRVDGGPTKEDRWRYRLNTARAVNLSRDYSLVRFMQDAADGSEFEIRLDPYKSPSMTTTFGIAGLRAAMGHVVESCKDKDPLG
jgi:hypothetical protein